MKKRLLLALLALIVICSSLLYEDKTLAQALTNITSVTSPVDACASPDGSITLVNNEPDPIYNLYVTETLAAGLDYVSGSTRWRLNGGAWNGPDASYDPLPSTSPLQWTSAQISGLATVNPGDTIEIEFALTADCPFTGGDVTVATQYEAPPGQVHNSTSNTFTVGFREPDITVTKTRANDPIGCSEAIQWTITVQNNSGYTLPILWVEDTMDAAFTYVSSVGDPPYTSDDGTNVGQVVTWELRNVNHGDTVTLTLNATTDSTPCSSDLDNEVRVWWGCGIADGSSATKPGVDAPDDDLCLTSNDISVTRTETRKPDLGFLNIATSPSSIDSCNDSTQVTIAMENSGPTDAYDIDLAITLPAGISYNAGTSEAGLGTDTASATAAIGAIGDPAITAGPAGSAIITFYDFNDQGSDLANVVQADGGNDTLVLRFDVQSACYTTDDLAFDLRFYDCCGDTQHSETTTQQLMANYPVLAVTKTPASAQVACGSQQSWDIAVSNNGTGNAEVVRVVDTLADWLDYVPGSFVDEDGVGTTPSEIGSDPQVVGWEFNNLGPGTTAKFSFATTLNPDGFPNQADCTAALRQNNVTVQWACGTSGDATDDNPNTTSYDCSDSGSATAGPTTLQMPNLVATNITPTITSNTDGNFDGSIVVAVENQGDGNSNDAFTVQVTDGKGWTGTGTHSGNIASGNSVNVTINTGAWTPGCHACSAPYSFNATADLNNDVGECNESNNIFGPEAYTVLIPDIAVQTDTLIVSGNWSGLFTVSGSFTLTNSGCGVMIDDIPVRFTIYDNTGCGGSIEEQWTETFSSVNIAANDGTQTFTSTNHTFTSTSCNDSTSCPVSIFVEADYNDNIAECDGTDNTYCVNKAISIFGPGSIYLPLIFKSE